MNKFIDAKLVLVEYNAHKADELIIDSLGLIRAKDELFFVTSDVKKIEKQLEEQTGDFVAKYGGDVELLEPFIVVEEDSEYGELSIGDVCIITNPNGDRSVVCYRLPDHDAAKSFDPSTDTIQKIIATSEQIAIVEREAYDSSINTQYAHPGKIVNYQINIDTIMEIIGDGGCCSVEIEENILENGNMVSDLKFTDGKITIGL